MAPALRRFLLLSFAAFAGCSYHPQGTCQAASDCPRGVSCTNGVCVGCADDASCQGWETCSASTHACVMRAGMCSRDGDCAASNYCDTTSHVCLLRAGWCATSADCASWEQCSPSHHCALLAGMCGGDADCQTWEACGAEHTCATKPFGGDVWLWGSLQPGACEMDAIAPIDAPGHALVGFACDATFTGAKLASGSVVYGQWDTVAGLTIRRFHPDAWVWDPVWRRWTYPTLGYQDDAVVPTPPCPDAVWAFAVQAGTGRLSYGCNGDTAWYDSDGVALTTGNMVRAWNASGAMLANPTADWRQWVLLSPGGASVPVAGLPYAPYVFYVRTNGNGFYLGVQNGTSNELWAIDASGVATLQGTFARPDVRTVAASAIDSSGALYATGDDGTHSMVFRCPLQPDLCTVAYTDANAPTNANDGPSNLYVLFRMGDVVLTTP